MEENRWGEPSELGLRNSFSLTLVLCVSMFFFCCLILGVLPFGMEWNRWGESSENELRNSFRKRTQEVSDFVIDLLAPFIGRWMTTQVKRLINKYVFGLFDGFLTLLHLLISTVYSIWIPFVTEMNRRGEPSGNAVRKTLRKITQEASNIVILIVSPVLGVRMTAKVRILTEELDKFIFDLIDALGKEEKLQAFEQGLQILKSDFMKRNKQKDLWHFFMSLYSMPGHITYDMVRRYKFLVNHPMRTCEAALRKKYIQLLKEKQIILSDLSLHSHNLDTTTNPPIFPSEMRRYLPRGWTLKNDRLESCAPVYPVSSSDTVPDWAIKSAVTQASHFITNGLGQLIAISGRDAKKVAQQLAQLAQKPGLRNKFDVVLLISLSQYRNSEEVRMGIEKEIQQLLGLKMSYDADGALKYLKFLLILDCIDESYFDLYELKIPIDHGLIVLTTQSEYIYQSLAVDMEIKVEYHLLPWELFCKNVNRVISISSPFNEVATRLLEECHSDLLATILLARALKNAEIDVWKQALDELMSSHSSTTEEAANKVLIPVLKFIWKQKNLTTRRCIQHFIECEKDEKTNADNMVSYWLLGGLVNTAEKGGEVMEELIDSFLIERLQQGNLHMQEKVKEALLKWILPHYGSERIGTEIIERDAKLIEIKTSELTALPRSPEFYQLEKLILNGSDLLKIDLSFFEHMPNLKVLDLSHSSIKTLPSSISKLVQLKKLILRCCELLMELPPEIGELRLLKVLDLDGTEIMYIPNEIEKLTILEELKLSICGHGERYRKAKNIKYIYPEGALSKLLNLKELSIDVNPEEKQWTDEVGYIISDLLRIKLTSLNLYLPKEELLGKLNPPNFKFTVGQYEQRMISRIPHEVDEKFKANDKSVRYINGETISTHLVNVLKSSHAFLLDRHWTIKNLSEVVTANLALLEFCFLGECNELETVLDEEEFQKNNNKQELQFDGRLGLLEYLGLHYLRNLTSICKGPVGKGTLSKLKHLSLRTCTNITQVFTIELLENLEMLEELVLEDCPEIKSLVNEKSLSAELGPFLPKLKKMSLLGLPELVSITNGICIAPDLEILVVFYCPKLENISRKELSCKLLKVLKGEREWWDSLEWDEWESDDEDDLAEIFVPISREGNLNAQLTEDVS